MTKIDVVDLGETFQKWGGTSIYSTGDPNYSADKFFGVKILSPQIVLRVFLGFFLPFNMF